jgi:hypothetical protein
MNKSLLMTQYKELYGGFYIRNSGRWYWKATNESEPVGPISGFWLRQQILEAKNRKVPTIEFTKIEESDIVKSQTEVTENVVEVKQEIKKSAPKKKPVVKKQEQVTETNDNNQ